ncbi:IS3 family transposase [Streptomyces sediminimaris]|uniref:IS3 family transposase n=1 Tax=Streptomyces sediminimaris TaxID=3383721 RepID=UPI003999BEAD
MRDAELKGRITKVFEANYRVYGARKIWRELNRQGRAVARCTVERLMRELGITGAVRGKRVITTLPGGQAERAPDLLDRDFVAAAPNRCWVADFTHVKTWAGVVYVAFVVDTFSRRDRRLVRGHGEGNGLRPGRSGNGRVATRSRPTPGPTSTPVALRDLTGRQVPWGLRSMGEATC